MSASRFNVGVIQQGIERAAKLYGLRTWIKVGDGRLRRDLDVTVHGDPAGIADLVT